ncbi:metal-dependent hydrolase [Acidovorax sp. LjRoot129]
MPGEPERFWNRTPFGSYLFNAFSLLLPAGEQFVVRAMEDAAAHLPLGTPLRDEVVQFVREERAHQRAHRQYNAQLAQQGYEAAALEARIERAVDRLDCTLGWQERLALAAALEFLTALVSRQALAGWLVDDGSRQATLWRWHCTEEVAHHGVALRLLGAVGQMGYARRVVLYGLASLILLADVGRHIASFFATDRAHGRLTWSSAMRSAAGFGLRHGGSLARMAVRWCGYGLPLRWLAPAPRTGRLVVRLLQAQDIPRLLVLEHTKWSEGQAASADAMAQRLLANPHLCLGAFCGHTGAALASLFLKPISEVQLHSARTWADCAEVAGGSRADQGGRATPCRDLFGISLSSISPDAVDAMFAFFWPQALKAGWRQIYLGSPVPGLARWREREPQGCVQSYVRTLRRGVPQDPQLRYYWRKGFRTVVACKPDYFPHPPSLDYGVVVRGRIPLSTWAPLWRCVPLAWLRGMGWCLSRVL